ncbi:alpha/beta fold hydrolase [Microbispora sp. NPDC049125]|uniref:alpha/beta fold hydrolase n=1 Tax=Microbispora sp. NPDC049125 TaxID=3154929 RepID=UPI00346761AA
MDQRSDVEFAETGGARLAYRVWGEPGGPPLVLLHALGEASADWDGVAPALAAGRRVYAPDLRGHGLSERTDAYSLELMRDDVLGLLDALELGRVDLIGHSMGGAVAYLLAAARPERVRRLVLEDVGAPLPRPRVVPARPEGALPFDWGMVLAIKAQIDEPDPGWLGLLGRITAPALVVAGGPASSVPQERVAELARRIPGGRMITIPSGHLVHAVRPDDFTRAVLEFLG